MARTSSGIVAGLTAAALTVVAFLAYQASANAPDSLAAPAGTVSPSTSPSGTSKKPSTPAALTLPADSGSGMRVVYALGAKHVWLVSSAGKLSRSFDVTPSTVNPPAGSYRVYSRAGSVTGSDGVQIEHVVRFTSVDDVTIGFSAAVDGSMPSPDPSRKTGGVRMKPADGDVMWPFATIGTKVIVVP
ncbi:hypothetical protein [Streptomyces beijiangensis]|uniref:Secreted protein n=1 Tax=Streptomyces beijiangensis TaxID=163361 RepID=A0A939FAN1_9ACTN|nr:hypothetical protein [Streptomyces beijiangensis]MBO0515122.1 hypothetical protein [Streptomyces beijiangensis]